MIHVRPNGPTAKRGPYSMPIHRRGEHYRTLSRREDIVSSVYYSWSKEFLDAGKRRLAGDTGCSVLAKSINIRTSGTYPAQAGRRHDRTRTGTAQPSTGSHLTGSKGTRRPYGAYQR
jgi:hypothetical protein